MDTPSIFEFTISDWAFIAMLSVIALGALFVMGMYPCQVWMRVFRRHRISVYRKWGVESDLLIPSFPWMIIGSYYLISEMALQKLLPFLGINRHLPSRSREDRISLMRSGPSWWIIVDSVFVAGCTAYVLWIAATLIGVLVNIYSVNSIIIEISATIAVIVFAIGFGKEFTRTEEIKTKIDQLDNLQSHSHRRFTKSELLSMYEALKFAPSSFWDEYSRLEESEIDENTNRKFREMAAPYQYSDTRHIAKTALRISIVALIIALIVAAIEQSGVFRDLLLRLL